MAVPGSPLDPRCRGTNRLIREGALLVEDAAQVLEAMDGIKSPNFTLFKNLNESAHNVDSEIENGSADLRDTILNLLGPSPVEVDELLRQCHCSAPVMGMVLLELDLAGRLERHPGNRVSLLTQGRLTTYISGGPAPYTFQRKPCPGLAGSQDRKAGIRGVFKQVRALREP